VKPKPTHRLLAAILGIAAGIHIAPAAEPGNRPLTSVPGETKDQRDARMGWWREARFGMFIHWGVYAATGGEYNGKRTWTGGEWVQNGLEIPVAEYKQLPATFNPVKFDAKTWVDIARAAGMRYMVITAKHHDGFAMFKSQASDFNIVDATPFKRDILKELTDACAAAELPLGFYYSQAQDWCHPGGTATKINKRKDGHWDPAQKGNMDDYIDRIAVPQVRELLTRYQPSPAVLWWDTPVGMNAERAAKLQAVVNEVRPGLITNNRLGGGIGGDLETPEQYIPPKGYPGRDWETCMTLNGTWGYKHWDHDWKSTTTLIRNLCDIASKGGNYLLNVGPDGLGEIPAASVQRLAEMGQWMKVNGESIYGTGPTAFGDECGSFHPTKKDKKGQPLFEPKWQWRCTTKPGKLYIHLFEWPAGVFTLEGVPGRITAARLIADPSRAIEVKQDGAKAEITLPGTAPDPHASVLCLDITDA
jgi:alpha-L-fucosidase